MLNDQAMQAMMGTIFIFWKERIMFLRENANKMYSVSAYYLAKILCDTPVLILCPFLFL